MSFTRLFNSIFDDVQTPFRKIGEHRLLIKKLEKALTDLEEGGRFKGTMVERHDGHHDFILLEIGDEKISEKFYVAFTSNPLKYQSTFSLYRYDEQHNKKGERLGNSKNEDDLFTHHGYNITHLDDYHDFFAIIAAVVGKTRAKYDRDQHDIKHNPRYD